MKLCLVGLLSLFLFAGCGKSEKEQLREELLPTIYAAAENMTVEAEDIYQRCSHARKINNLNEVGFLKIDSAHSIASRFIFHSYKMREEHQYSENYPFEEIDIRFHATFDSLRNFLPSKKIKAYDYSKSKYKDDLALTTARMDYDIAELEVEILNNLMNQHWVTIFRDDFRTESISQ